MAQGIERRSAHRAPIGAQVSWTLDNREWYEDSSRDVSSTGMMLRTQQPVDIGTVIQLSFKLPNLKFQDPVVAKAEVVRVVQRHGRQIGVGVRFRTLSSVNYEVVHEFVCRILDLPLNETMADLASHGASGYTFELDRLIEKADVREGAAAERKLAKLARAEALRRKTAARMWTRRGLRIGLVGLVLVGIFLVLKVAGFVLNWTVRIQ